MWILTTHDDLSEKDQSFIDTDAKSVCKVLSWPTILEIVTRIIFCFLLDKMRLYMEKPNSWHLRTAKAQTSLRSLVRAFSVRYIFSLMAKYYAGRQRRPWSDCLHWAFGGCFLLIIVYICKLVGFPIQLWNEYSLWHKHKVHHNVKYQTYYLQCFNFLMFFFPFIFLKN